MPFGVMLPACGASFAETRFFSASSNATIGLSGPETISAFITVMNGRMNKKPTAMAISAPPSLRVGVKDRSTMPNGR